MSHGDMSPLADQVYAELRQNGAARAPLDLGKHNAPGFERLLALLRLRAAKDGYRVYTSKRCVPVFRRVFELHYPPTTSGLPARKQPDGIVRP
jgi:hypothetical protein